jgi:hypothetical protein
LAAFRTSPISVQRLRDLGKAADGFRRDDAFDQIVENDAVDVITLAGFRHHGRRTERIGEVIRIEGLFHRVARAEQGRGAAPVSAESRRCGVDDVHERDRQGLLQGRSHHVHRVRGEENQSGASLFQSLAGFGKFAACFIPGAGLLQRLHMTKVQRVDHHAGAGIAARTGAREFA